MGKQKYIREIERLFAKSAVVSFKSIERFVKSKTRAKQYAKQLVRNLVRAGKIKPLGKGYYTSKNDVSLAVFAYQPAYLGLQDALSYHNLWEQETIPVIITARRVRTGIRRVLDSNVQIRYLNPKYHFGIEHSPEALPYSEVEKTLIDLIYFRQPVSPEVRKEFRKRINRQKLGIYLRKYPPRFKAKVLKMMG